MAKKTIKAQILEANEHLIELDEQSKAVAAEKKVTRIQIKQLEDELVAELGRTLMKKMALDEINPESIDQAFEELKQLPVAKNGQGGVTDENY
ncbi:hypothetical protein [Leuconostoc citreum]|uniref:hypothetical protein n=1 Tax=Leuconostoc citreum TaxID=33964 RepID=UPI0032DE737E